MKKLHTLFFIFSALASAQAETPQSVVPQAALQNIPAAKEPGAANPLAKLMEVLAKAKQSQGAPSATAAAQPVLANPAAAQPIVAAPLVVASTVQVQEPLVKVTNAKDLLSFVNSQGLSFADSLEKLGIEVSKKVAKRLNNKKRGGKIFLNKIKKEGLSWQEAATSLSSAPAITPPVAPAPVTPSVGDYICDFKRQLMIDFPNEAPSFIALLDGWRSVITGVPNGATITDFADTAQNLGTNVVAHVANAFKTVLSAKQLESFEKGLTDLYLMPNTSALLSDVPALTNLYTSIQSKTDDLSKVLSAFFKTELLPEAYRRIEGQLDSSSFKWTEAALPVIANNVLTPGTGSLTESGLELANGLKSIQDVLYNAMTPEGLGRLILGTKTITDLYAGYALVNTAKTSYAELMTAIKADTDFTTFCKSPNTNGTALVDDAAKTQKTADLLQNIFKYVPMYMGMTYRSSGGTSSTPIECDRVLQLQNMGYGNTLNMADLARVSRSLISAAKKNHPIESDYTLFPEEKAGAYYSRHLLEGGAASAKWISNYANTSNVLMPYSAEEATGQSQSEDQEENGSRVRSSNQHSVELG